MPAFVVALATSDENNKYLLWEASAGSGVNARMGLESLPSQAKDLSLQHHFRAVSQSNPIPILPSMHNCKPRKKTMPRTKSNRSPFLELPPEIRIAIYELIRDETFSEGTISINSAKFPEDLPPSITRVNRQTRQETLKLMCEPVKIEFDAEESLETCGEWVQTISDGALQCLSTFIFPSLPWELECEEFIFSICDMSFTIDLKEWEPVTAVFSGCSCTACEWVREKRDVLERMCRELKGAGGDGEVGTKRCFLLEALEVIYYE